MAQGQTFSADQKARLVEVLRDTGSVAYACAAVGINRSTYRRHREIDEDFAQALADAEMDAADAMELEARRRAIEGEVIKTVRNRQGEVIIEERKRSDPLLMFLLKGRRREVFGDKAALDLSSSDGSMSPQTGDTEAAARIASFLAIAARRQMASETGVELPPDDDGSDLV